MPCLFHLQYLDWQSNLLPEFSDVSWNPFFHLRIECFLCAWLSYNPKAKLIHLLLSWQGTVYIKLWSFVSSNTPSDQRVQFHFMYITSKDVVLRTSDIHSCDEVMGTISFWWLLHADHVCASNTAQCTTTSVSAKPSCRSLVSFWGSALPFCQAYGQFDLKVSLVCLILPWRPQFSLTAIS